MKAIDNEKAPTLLRDIWRVANGGQLESPQQHKLKEMFDNKYADFLKLQERQQEAFTALFDDDAEAAEDPGTEAALKVARDWLERHGVKQ